MMLIVSRKSEGYGPLFASERMGNNDDNVDNNDNNDDHDNNNKNDKNDDKK